MIASVRSALSSLKRSARLRILVTAFVAGLVGGLIQIGQPVDDFFFGSRTMLRPEPSSGDIVFVNVDDRTLSELNVLETPRSADAKMIDRVFDDGARRIYFDRTFSFASTPGEDQALIRAFDKWRGKVYIGAIASKRTGSSEELDLLPHPKFRDHVNVVSLMGRYHPFSLGMSLYYSSETPTGRVPSMAASIAGRGGDRTGLFRPDLQFDYQSFRNYSFIDVVEGRVPAGAFADKTVIVAPTASIFRDRHVIPPRGNVPGSLFHAIGAETLRNGVPLQIGWLPLLLMAIGILATGMKRGTSFDGYRICGIVATIVILPFVLDGWNVEFEIVPAAIAIAVGIMRARSLDRVEAASETNASSGLPTLKVLRNDSRRHDSILVALKIRNYSGILGSFAGEVDAQIAREIVRRIRISEPDVTVYQEGGVFVWFSQIQGLVDLCENLEGLHRIVQNGISIDQIEVDFAFNCGVDPEFERSISGRVASAMQSAEEAARNDELVCLFDSDKHEAHWEISLLTQLDRAIDNGEVWVAYQPKLDVRSGEIKGAEALVRWSHPERGPISPEKFIRIAEEYHRIERITRFVVADAVRTAVAMLRDGYDFTVSVNISAQLLRNPGLPRMLSEILEAYGLAPERLILEITETDRLERSSKTYHMLQQLVASGLGLSIDDFGTGNATIDYLRYLPAGEVKIDKSFVHAIETSAEDYVLVQSILEMAHSLKRKVVAEGVESKVALEMLTRLGCDAIQGYYVSPPVPFRDLQLVIAGREALHTG